MSLKYLINIRSCKKYNSCSLSIQMSLGWFDFILDFLTSIFYKVFSLCMILLSLIVFNELQTNWNQNLIPVKESRPLQSVLNKYISATPKTMYVPFTTSVMLSLFSSKAALFLSTTVYRPESSWQTSLISKAWLECILILFFLNSGRWFISMPFLYLGKRHTHTCFKTKPAAAQVRFLIS